ncbi:Cupredoxin [Chytriomyces sp. MP71]|nr:Cupredoxin [Chytriomyces sp. MP71]
MKPGWHLVPGSEAEAGPRPVAEAEAAADGGHEKRSPWFIISVLALVFVAAIGAAASVRHARPSPTPSSPKMLGLQLRPREHANRPPATLTFNWTITSGRRAPDGVEKGVLLVNDAFPGPLIEARTGDRVIVHVTNKLQSVEGVSIHWHGLAMREANHMDGAIGVTQCPIAVNSTFVYDFNVGEVAGTFWWHGHSQLLRGDGLWGGLVVHEPADVEPQYEYEKDVLLLIGDWYHRSANDMFAWYKSPSSFGSEPLPDSLLVNGVGRFQCDMMPAARELECNELVATQIRGLFGDAPDSSRIRLRVINVGSLAGFTFEVSSASLTPITLDGGFQIESIPSASVGILYPGQRVDVLLQWNNRSSLTVPQLMIALDPENLKNPNPALRANQSFAAFGQVNFASPEPQQTRAIHCDIATVLSRNPVNLQPNVNQTILLYTKTQRLAILDNLPTGFINRTTWIPQDPPIRHLPRASWDNHQLVPFIPQFQWVDLIINNLDDGAHPFHLHGHDMYLLASSRSEHGWGSYTPYEGAPAPVMELARPVRVDTVAVPRRGYVVVRVHADNPGVWMMHCHMLYHQASGMAFIFHVGEREDGVEGVRDEERRCEGV